MTFDERLDNWGRWCRSRMYSQAQCSSLEGNYRSKQPWDAPVPCDPPPRVKPFDAWDVELAAATLSTKHHAVLKLKHVRRHDDQRIAKELKRATGERTKPSDIIAVYGMARVLLLAALDTPVPERRERTVSYARQLMAA